VCLRLDIVEVKVVVLFQNVPYLHLYSPKQQQQQMKSKNKTNADDRLTASLPN